MKKGKFRYLVKRLWVVSIFGGGLSIIMLSMLIVVSLTVNSELLWWTIYCILLFLALVWVSVVWIIKPYYKIEKSI